MDKRIQLLSGLSGMLIGTVIFLYSVLITFNNDKISFLEYVMISFALIAFGNYELRKYSGKKSPKIILEPKEYRDYFFRGSILQILPMLFLIFLMIFLYNSESPLTSLQFYMPMAFMAVILLYFVISWYLFISYYRKNVFIKNYEYYSVIGGIIAIIIGITQIIDIIKYNESLAFFIGVIFVVFGVSSILQGIIYKKKRIPNELANKEDKIQPISKKLPINWKQFLMPTPFKIIAATFILIIIFIAMPRDKCGIQNQAYLPTCQQNYIIYEYQFLACTHICILPNSVNFYKVTDFSIILIFFIISYLISCKIAPDFDYRIRHRK